MHSRGAGEVEVHIYRLGGVQEGCMGGVHAEVYTGGMYRKGVQVCTGGVYRRSTSVQDVYRMCTGGVYRRGAGEVEVCIT